MVLILQNGRASAMPPKGQSRVFSKLGHKEGKELIGESTLLIFVYHTHVFERHPHKKDIFHFHLEILRANMKSKHS